MAEQTARQRAEADMLGCLPPELVAAHLDGVEAEARASLAADIAKLPRRLMLWNEVDSTHTEVVQVGWAEALAHQGQDSNPAIWVPPNGAKHWDWCARVNSRGAMAECNCGGPQAIRAAARARRPTVAELTTEAGQQLLDGFAPMPLPDAPELHRRSAMGRRNKLIVGLHAVEAEARASLDAMGLAVAMNTAQVDPREIQLGHDLLPVAERVAKAYNSARRATPHSDLALGSRAEQEADHG